MSRRIAWIAGLVLIAIIGHRGVSGAQTPVHSKCRDPHALPTCGGYFLFELGGTARISGTTITSCNFACRTESPLPGYGAVDLGWMKNVNMTRALGASVSIGGSDDGSRFALRARHRSWLSNGLIFDAGAGPLLGTRGAGLTGDVAFGRARLGTLLIGQDIAQRNGGTVVATHAGARLESSGGAIGTVVVVGFAVGLLVAIASAGGR